MSLESFEKEQLSKPEQAMIRMKSITNYIMGFAFICIGIAILFPTETVAKFTALYDSLAIKMLAIICIIYGIFRVYRGYKKNYFRES